MGKETSITCYKATKRRLEAHGRKRETWDGLLNRIANEAGVPDGDQEVEEANDDQ